MKKHDKMPDIIDVTDERIEELKCRVNENKLTKEDELFLEKLLTNTQEAIKYIKTHQR